MPLDSLTSGAATVTAVQPEHIQAIREWRNAQLHVLRQTEPITVEQQERYYAEHIWPTMKDRTPKNVLLTYLHGGTAIAYGGLVHIDWSKLQAEVSFLMAPEFANDTPRYREHHLAFLGLLRELAFSHMGFRSLFTETYEHRTQHMQNLEAFGFVRERVDKDKISIEGKALDSVFHVLQRGEATL